MTRTAAAVRVVVVTREGDGVFDALDAMDEGVTVETVAPGDADRLDRADCVVVTDPADAPTRAADADAGDSYRPPVVLYADTPPAAVADPGRFAAYARRGDPAALADQIRWVTRARGPDVVDESYPDGSRIRRLHEGATDLTAARTPDELFASAVDTAARILAFDQCYVGITEGDEVVPRAESASVPTGSVRTRSLSDGLVGRTVRTGESFLVHDMATDPDARPDDDTFRSGVSVPVGGVGVFQAVSTHVGAFDAADLELAELLADHVAVVYERLRAEQEVREEHDRLAALFENVPDAAVAFEFVDGVPVVRAVNSAFERVFGFGVEEVVGEDIDDRIVPADPDAERSAAHLNELLRRGESVRRECRRSTRTGDREFLLHVIPLRIGETNVAGYAIYTDVTERDRRERLLASLHETSRHLMRADTAEEVYDVSVEAMERVFGYPVCGLRTYDPETDALTLAVTTDATRRIMNPRPTYPRGEGVVWEVYRTGEPRVFDDVSTIRDGYDRTGVRSVMYLPVGDRGVLSVGSVRPDEFSESTKQVGMILAANVETALDRAERTHLLRERERELRRQNERLEEFASIVSHDLRNPLSVARGYLDIAEERCDADAFDRVRRSLDRMDGLIETLLSLARKGEVVGETAAVDAVAVASAAWAGVDTADAALEPTGECTVDADEERLRDLFENLFRNSVEHGSTNSRARPDDSVGHADSSVRVRIGPLDGDDGFYVEDDGPGVPEAERERVFRPGHTTGGDGIGFGLPIVRRIAEAHGWTLDLTESADGGARFEVRTGDGPGG